MPNGVAFVVLHYFSWYVFSYGKFSGIKASQKTKPVSVPTGTYDRFLWSLRNPLYFTLVLIALNAISFAGVIWYHQGGGPDVLKYAFRGEFFIYILLFHVTFSINPRRLLNFFTPKPAAV